MKNKLTDLNDHLFAQLERLSDEELTAEEIAAANGPIPDGHCLKSLDGNRLNTDPSNWTLIPRSLLPFLNGHRGPSYDQAQPEVRPAILTLAKLKQARCERGRTRGPGIASTRPPVRR